MKKEEKIARLVNWNSDSVDDRLVQIAERIDFLKKEWSRVEVITMLVCYSAERNETYYEPSFTQMRPADLLWASEVLRQRALAQGEEVP